MSRAMMKSLPLALVLFATSAAPAFASQDTPPPYRGGESRPEPIDPSYLEAIQRTSAMVWDDKALRLAQMHGLDLINVTWEDTGRFYDSAVGPNISDMTIQVQHQDPDTGEFVLSLMPVIRYPNFVDHTADISPDDFYLLVGNEDGGDLERVTLAEYLDNFRKYLSDPGSWSGRRSSLLAPRDSHVLVSAQAAFLPVPQQGEATFNPVIFNYQSYAGDPAVLTIVASREGTSATIIDNMRDSFPAGWSWGQRLFFNQDGERASFTGERLSDFVDRTLPPDMVSPTAAGESGLNMVLLIQVPLKQREPMRGMFFGDAMAESAAPSADFKVEGDVEAAVIGHGKVEGPYTEIDGLAIERDPQFPIRVTVQFYKATSNGIVTEADMQAIASHKYEPPGWWDTFWHRFENNLQFSRWEAMDVLKELGAVAWHWFGAITR